MASITLASQLIDAGFPSRERAGTVEEVLNSNDLTDIQVGGQTFVCSLPFALT